MRIDYQRLANELIRSDPEGLSSFWDAISGLWQAQYASFTAWSPELVEIPLGGLTYLFDLAPSHGGTAAPEADDRVVGVYGRTGRPQSPRDAARQAGFVRNPIRWSRAGYDRGHYVAHSLGGGMDINFFPQVRELNRGWSSEGRRWREIERRASAHDGTPILARPIYDGPGWTPAGVELGVIVNGVVDMDWFDNRVR